MTLRRKMGYQIGATIVALLLLSAASLWGINALHADVGSAVQGYEELRGVYQVGSHVIIARAILASARPDEQRALREVEAARDQMELFLASRRAALSEEVRKLEMSLREGLVEAHRQIESGIAMQSGDVTPEALSGALNRVLGQIANLDAAIGASIKQKQRAADAKRRATLIVMAGLSLAVVIGAVVVGVLQYRSVMNPLSRLGENVRKIAAGQFKERMTPVGSAEFVELAEDFNRMAGELDSLYHELEQKVEAKSRELVRSERLASVGYLAAGVAHEINNPLSIITGYAEMSLKKLGVGNEGARGRGPAVSKGEGVTEALRVICEEAFRCKQIIEKLLSLARPGEEKKQPVSLAAVAKEVVSMVEGLPAYRERKIELREDAKAKLTVLAAEGEMKQVLLNLVLNALEAVEPKTGRVEVEVRRTGEWVELVVRDNGRGMDAATLERVFEPFFTARRGSGSRGTGLGLSITHAIVQGYGGRISAQSEGLGKGATFTVQLPGE